MNRAARLALGLLAVVWTAFAAAQDSAVWTGPYNGLEVEVTVIDRDGLISDEVQQTQPWWTWGDTVRDAYLFRFEGREGTDLVLSFEPRDGRPEATLYVPLPRQRSAVRALDGQLVLPGDLSPTLQLRPRGEVRDWLIGDEPTFDLEVVEYDEFGEAKWEVTVAAEAPGVPAWSTSELLLEQDPYPGRGIPRFGAAVRADPGVAYERAEPLMPSWPYLTAGYRTAFAHYGPVHPIGYNIDFNQLSTTFVGFHTAGMYQVNSLSRPPDVDFESPFAFYRFDPEFGTYPNLLLRHDVWPESSRFGPVVRGAQRTAVRMAWTEEQRGRWRYALTTLGNHPMDQTVTIGDAELNLVPYDRFPEWVAERPWKVVTMVEATEGETGSEGIYEYSVQDHYEVSYWANGMLDAEPAIFDAPWIDFDIINPRRLAESFRGEYGLSYNREPEMYVSPIDNRLHLLYAEGGLWNLGGLRVLRVHNLDGDATIDGWTRELVTPPPPLEVAELEATDEELEAAIPRAWPGEVESGVWVMDGYLLYTGAFDGTRESVIRRADAPLEVLRVRPPTDAESWNGFVETMAPFRDQVRDPFDMRGWLDAFPGPTVALDGARIRDVRPTDSGFRFVLDLADPVVLPELALPGLPATELAAGEYVTTFDVAAERWTFEPAEPLALSFDLIADLPQAYLPGTLDVVLDNRSNVDWRGPVELWIGDELLESWTGVQVPARSRVVRTAYLTPRPGLVEFTVASSDGPVLARSARVDKRRYTDLSSTLWWSVDRNLGNAILLALLIVVLATSVWRTRKLM